MSKSRLVPAQCTSSTCEEYNGQRFAATFILLTEDSDGAPVGAVLLCGPCAAGMAYYGAIVKSRPLAMANGDRLGWPE